MSTLWQRLSYAFRSFFSLLFQGTLPVDVAGKVCPSPSAAAALSTASVRPVVERTTSGEAAAQAAEQGAIHMLALLQRDGRLIDFLLEDISPYPDAQLGAAVRSVHQSCKAVLDRYFTLGAVIPSEEDQPVTVQAGVDPASIKLIGNVTGSPPLRGVLRHRGWIVTNAKLPAVPADGKRVIAPAEVEF